MGTNSSTRQLLSKIWHNQKIIDHNNRTIQSMRDDLERIRYAAEGVKAIRYNSQRIQAAADDRMPDVVADLIEAEEKDLQRISELTLENNRLEMERAALIQNILNLDNPRCSEFLYKRYVESKRIGEIQDEMKFKTYNACTNFHAYSLRVYLKKNSIIK